MNTRTGWTRRTGIALLASAAMIVPPALAEEMPDPAAGAPASAEDAQAAIEAARLAKYADEAREAKRVKLTGGDHNVIRTGPGDRYAIVGVYGSGEVFQVLAKRDDWYNVQVSVVETGWVHASLCEEFDDLSVLEFRPNPRMYSRVGAFTLTGFGGAYGFDRKSNSLVLGGRLGYYIFDFLQVEGGVGWTHIRRPGEVVESLFDLSLEAEEFHMLFYHFNATVEVLPGRRMVPYITGGVGSTIMLGKTEPAYNYGAGTSLFFGKRTAMRWEFRAYEFESGVADARRKNHNIEFSLGTTLLF